MKNIFFLLIGVITLASCNNETERKFKNESTENEMDAARNFIQAALEGKYDVAETYLLKDSVNIEHFNMQKRYYNERMSDADKDGYKTATIHIYNKRAIDESTSILVYSNSYKNQKDSLKIVKQGNKWLIDFKYIF